MEHATMVVSIAQRFSAEASHLRQSRCTALKGTPDNGQQGSQLNTPFPTNGGSRPSDEKTSNRSACTVKAVCGGDGFGSLSSIAWFSLHGKVKVLIPAWLTDGTPDNGRAVTIGLCRSVIEMQGRDSTHHRPKGHGDSDESVVRARMGRDMFLSSRHDC
jgi:hypothetical protein